MGSFTIRLADAAELTALQQIEVDAGQAFDGIGMGEVARDEPPSEAWLSTRLAASLLWVAADADDAPVAYLAGELVDGTGHVLQVSVAGRAARRGVGARLLSTFEQWASGQGLTELTLTTFRDVPWNAPYYERLGWRLLDPSELGPGLRAIREHEAERGLDRWPRCAMNRAVAPDERGA